MWKNTFQAYCVKGVIDLSAGDGEICIAAMRLRKPCLAFCLSNSHVRLLFNHLVSWMLTNMADETSVHYNTSYAKFKAGGDTAPDQARASASSPNDGNVSSENKRTRHN